MDTFFIGFWAKLYLHLLTSQDTLYIYNVVTPTD